MMSDILCTSINTINSSTICLELVMAIFVRGDDLLKFGIKRFIYQAPTIQPKQKRKISDQFKQNKKRRTIKNA